jgi:hypothetical protein
MVASITGVQLPLNFLLNCQIYELCHIFKPSVTYLYCTTTKRTGQLHYHCSGFAPHHQNRMLQILGPDSTIPRAHWCPGNSVGCIQTYYKMSAYTNLKVAKCIDKHLGNAKVTNDQMQSKSCKMHR